MEEEMVDGAIGKGMEELEGRRDKEWRNGRVRG